MIYDRRKEPEYNNNQRSDSSLFDDRRRSSYSRASHPRPNYTYNADFFQELERQEERRYLNSLPTFELDLETETNSQETEEKKPETAKKPETEENKTDTPRKSLFPGVLKPITSEKSAPQNQAQAKSPNSSKKSQPTTAPKKSNSTTPNTPNKSSTPASAETGDLLANKTVISQIPLNSPSPPNNTKTTTTTPQITPPTETPIFIAPDLRTANQSNPQTILGKTQTGAILYTSSNPSQTLGFAQEQDLNIKQLPSNATNAFYSQQQNQADIALSNIAQKATTAKENSAYLSQNSLTRLDQTITSIDSSLPEIINQQQIALTEIMNRSRDSIISAANQHIAGLEARNTAVCAEIDNRAELAVSILQQQRYSALSSIQQTDNQCAYSVNQAINETSQFFQKKENNCFDVVGFMEKTLARKYSKEEPPLAVLPQTQNLEASDRAIYTANWRNAKVQAVTQTASQLRAKITPTFAEHRVKLQTYRTTATEGTHQLANAKKETIDAQYQAQLALINQQAQAAKDHTKELLNQAISNAQQTEQEQLNQIDNQQQQYQQQLDNQAQHTQNSFTQLGVQVKTGLLTHHQKVTENLNQSVSLLQNRLNPQGDIPALARVPSSAQSIQQEIAHLETITAQEIENSTNTAISQLTEARDTISSQLTGITNLAQTEQNTQLNQYRNQQKAQSDLLWDNYSDYVVIIGGEFQNIAHQNNQQWKLFDQELNQEYRGVRKNLNGILETARVQVQKQQDTFERVPSRVMKENATAAASKVQPTWKKFLKIGVNVLITVGVTVAIGALAMSGVGLLAGLGLAALIGAAGGVAKLAANDIIDDTSSSVKDYLKAAAFGAATGMLEFVGGRIIKGLGSQAQKQLLLRLEKGALSTITETVTNTATELIQMWEQGEDISAKTLGIAAGAALASAVGGKFIDLKFSDVEDIAQGVTKGLKKEVGEKTVKQAWGKKVGQFVTETAFDTGVETGASLAKGEEITAESMLTNVGSAIMARGVSGRVDKLYGQKIRDLGTHQSKFQSLKKQDELGKTASGKSANQVEVYTDPDLVGNTVQVDWKFNDDNTITGVAMRAAPDATTRDIEIHQHTARVMSRYGGVLGRIRVAEAKIAKVLGIKGHPRPGSKAWEAQHEIYKLKQISYDLDRRIKTANPIEASQLEAQLVNIQSQLQQHIQTFKREDDSDGVGYVAAEGLEDANKRLDSIDDLNTRLSQFLETPPTQEIVIWGEKQKQRLEELKKMAAEVKFERDKLSRTTGNARKKLEKNFNKLTAEFIKEADGVEKGIFELETLSRLHSQPNNRLADNELESLEDIHGIRHRLKETNLEPEVSQRGLQEPNLLSQKWLETSSELDNEGVRDWQPDPTESDEFNLLITEPKEKAAQEFQDIEQDVKDIYKGLGEEIITKKKEEDSKLRSQVGEINGERNKLQLQMSNDLKNLSNSKLRDGILTRYQIELENSYSPKELAEKISKNWLEKDRKLLDEIELINKERELIRKEIKDIIERGELSSWSSHQYGNSDIEPCFPPGTLVKTPKGYKQIEDFVIGDLVLAYDLNRNETVAQPILELYKSQTEYLVDISIDGEIITATRQHRFWIESSKEWLPASELESGMKVRLANDSLTTVDFAKTYGIETETYNLEVADVHNYFVGNNGTLVHNGKGDSDNNSNFAKTNKKKGAIYRIVDLSFGKPVTIYIGQTFQENPEKRFLDGHLKDKHPKKADWVKKYKENSLKFLVIKPGNFTDYELAVWEQHYIDVELAKGSPLVNDLSTPPISKEKYKKFKSLHDPCV